MVKKFPAILSFLRDQKLGVEVTYESGGNPRNPEEMKNETDKNDEEDDVDKKFKELFRDEIINEDPKLIAFDQASECKNCI